MKAKEARQITEKRQSLILEQVYYQIEDAAKKGFASVFICRVLNDQSIKTLERKGYRVIRVKGILLVSW